MPIVDKSNMGIVDKHESHFFISVIDLILRHTRTIINIFVKLLCITYYSNHDKYEKNATKMSNPQLNYDNFPYDDR